jgi:hypothetical protein
MRTCWVYFSDRWMNRRTVHNMADAQNHAPKCLEEQLIVSAALVGWAPYSFQQKRGI